jgi:Fe2+ transport system protein FeoA
VIAAQAQQTTDRVLTNEAVVKLVKAGFKEKTVITIIHNRPGVFKLEPEQLIQLKRQGVSENIILAMLSTQDAGFVLNEDEWVSDERFFNRGADRKPTKDEESSGTSIFGSGGSSQSSSESRSGNGGNVNEGNVTGSASVKIIRPQSETGAASPKLEKTPVLNNDGVIRLVEAGFSEGTIIKRIEESPVEFDLSPGKLDELYKKRVTDPIITAMAAAMGKDR